MHRAAVPPPPHRPAARADNDPAAAMPLNQDAVPGNIFLSNRGINWSHHSKQLMQKQFCFCFFVCRGTRERSWWWEQSKRKWKCWCRCRTTRESMVGNSERDSNDSFRLHNFTTPWLPQHRLVSLFFFSSAYTQPSSTEESVYVLLCRLWSLMWRKYRKFELLRLKYSYNLDECALLERCCACGFPHFDQVGLRYVPH